MNKKRTKHLARALSFQNYFKKLTGYQPHDYQLRVAEELFEGNNIILRAPTGAGKTIAVIVPFLVALNLVDQWRYRPSKLIYALPLRTLANGIYKEAQQLAEIAGVKNDFISRTDKAPFVTIQTGEQPDDPFFDRGKIIVTTYDQVLSGLLCGPYGLSDRLHNINSAAIVGALVVFDEFHLMEPHKSFLTANALLNLYGPLCQSVWMTATATSPLESVIKDALGATTIPETEEDYEIMLNSLPSVTSVTRNLAIESNILTAEKVLGQHERHSIVLLNTVARAQSFFSDLKTEIDKNGLPVKPLLLHSRFFKKDRKEKEEELRRLFGKEATNSAILVATQVIEAGIDISSEHLHTELCPMNSLIQRAGRCARFPGETGTVHVYPLPEDERWWLPYGNLFQADEALLKTRELLVNTSENKFTPAVAKELVQLAHGEDDERALREGWRSRLKECLGRIEQNSIMRDPKRVADLIRGKNTETLQVIISSEKNLPDRPGARECIGMTRSAVAKLLRDDPDDLGWFWDWTAEEPWQPIRSIENLERAYVVALLPSIAAYDKESGLRLGMAGDRESPPREEPPPPGYAPLRAELWALHAKKVAAWASSRFVRDEAGADSLLGKGMTERYGLSTSELSEAVQACAYLHDLGKLQEDWQEWAKAAQMSKQPDYSYKNALAHTDFDSNVKGDLEREAALRRRPAHAPASAYYGRLFLSQLLTSTPEKPLVAQVAIAGTSSKASTVQLRTTRTYVNKAILASACIAAVVAHHGGWWSSQYESPGKLSPLWKKAVVEAIGWLPDKASFADLKRYSVDKFLSASIGPEELEKYWPLVAYLTRTLRLSDQRATAEGAGVD